MHDKGEKTSVKNAMKVFIDLEAEAHAASTGVNINTLGEAKDWNYSDCNGQVVQYDMNTCGVLVLLAFLEQLTLCHAINLFLSLLLSGIVQW
jgi:hypothetical protein